MRAGWIVVVAGLVGCAADTSDEAAPYGHAEIPACLKLEGAWTIDADPVGASCDLQRLNRLDFASPVVRGKPCTLSRSTTDTNDRTCTYRYMLECKSGTTADVWDLELMQNLDAPNFVVGNVHSHSTTGITTTCAANWDVTLTR
jgi:hypothetical protein